MRYRYLSIALCALALASCASSSSIPGESLTFKSAAFFEGEAIPPEFTCDGRNVSPPLAISGIPDGTQRLAIIVSDPDAPSGNWVHWVIWNIPVDSERIAPGAVPDGATEGKTSFGKPGYSGPCPPAGKAHHYFFTVYALKRPVTLPGMANAAALQKAMEGQLLGEATLTGTYERKKG